ncbi:MAG TPA: class I SAM-dependent methyltransferase [Acidimicrobiales bacterium]|nr:class I SAM-dependent methyltransferase [Acidimicrobiales bacterium]
MSLDAPVPSTDLYWSDELETLHEESSRTHFLDAWTRRAIVDQLGTLPENPTICDLGCSTGYLLEDLAAHIEGARLVGIDYIFSGLRVASKNVPRAGLVRADAGALPLAVRSLDALVSANLLEHVPDDVNVLREVRRVLRPGSRAVLVVPAGAGTYDYYDRFLCHQRRYQRGELATKARDAGLEVLFDGYIASLIFPAFWLAKKLNRLRFSRLDGDALRARVARDIAATKDSRLGRLTWLVERCLGRVGIRFPVGIRELVVISRPGATVRSEQP